MSEINENKLLEKLQALLKDQEKVEHFAKPLKEVYDKLYKQQIIDTIVSFLIAHSIFSYVAENLPFSLAFVLLYLGLNMFTIIFVYSAIKVKKTYPHSLYAYSNMRLFFTISLDPKIKYVYFKDIHELKTKNKKVIIDTGDTVGGGVKATQEIIGIPNPEDFVKEIDQKLQNLRMPS